MQQQPKLHKIRSFLIFIFHRREKAAVFVVRRRHHRTSHSIIARTHFFDFACIQARKTRQLDDARTSHFRSELRSKSKLDEVFPSSKNEQKSFITARFTQLTQFNSLRPCFRSRMKTVDVSRSLTSRTTTEKYNFRVFSPASRCYETHEKNKILYCMRGCVCASSEHNINIPPGRCWAECIDIVGQGRMRN